MVRMPPDPDGSQIPSLHRERLLLKERGLARDVDDESGRREEGSGRVIWDGPVSQDGDGGTVLRDRAPYGDDLRYPLALRGRVLRGGTGIEAPRPSKANSHVNHEQKEADLFDGCHAVSKSNSHAKGAISPSGFSGMHRKASVRR